MAADGRSVVQRLRGGGRYAAGERMSGRGSGEGQAPEDGDAELRARSGKLSAAIAAQRNADAAAAAGRLKARQRTSQAGQAYNLGFRMLAELVAGVLVGLAIGWGLDHWLGTSPLMMLLFLFLGTAGAVLNVMRAASPPRR